MAAQHIRVFTKLSLNTAALLKIRLLMKGDIVYHTKPKLKYIYIRYDDYLVNMVAESSLQFMGW